MNQESELSKTVAITRLTFITCFVVLALSGCEKLSGIKDQLLQEKDPPAASEKTSTKKVKETPKPSPKNVVLRVNDWFLTRDDFQDRLNALREVVPDFDTETAEARELVIEELTRQQLLIQEAEKTGIASSNDIEEAVKEFRNTLIVREVAEKLTENITVTEEEARQFYDENIEVLVEPIQYRVSEIVVEDEVKATELKAGLLQGADFAQMARLNSISPSASDGGDLGFIAQEPFPEMVNQILALEVGEVSPVFRGPDGFYLIKLTETAGGEAIPYEEIKEDIIQNQRLVKQQEAILDHIEELRSKADIEVNEALLQN